MYSKAKGNNTPSDAQARERLALYVYEYLVHVGAQKTATTFLSEIRWDKSISVGDSPGFLHSWWCVFWDLYSAAPERRDSCEHSSEAKAFHDYSSAITPSPLNSVGPPDGMNGPMGSNFFPPGSASSPSPHHNPSVMRPAFMPSRYSTSGPRGMHGPGPQPMLQGMDRQNQLISMHRMPHPRPMSAPMNAAGWSPSAEQYQSPMAPYNQMRLGGNSMPGPGPGGMPMAMQGRQWANPVATTGPAPMGQPGTPGMHNSPQDSMNSDYGPIPGKPMGHSGLPGQFPTEGGPPTSIPMPGPTNPASSMSMLNGMNGSGSEPGMEVMPKSSPSSLTPMNSNMSNPSGTPMPVHSVGPVTNPCTPQDGEGDSFGMQFPDNVNSNPSMRPGF